MIYQDSHSLFFGNLVALLWAVALLRKSQARSVWIPYFVNIFHHHIFDSVWNSLKGDVSLCVVLWFGIRHIVSMHYRMPPTGLVRPSLILPFTATLFSFSAWSRRTFWLPSDHLWYLESTPTLGHPKFVHLFWYCHQWDPADVDDKKLKLSHCLRKPLLWLLAITCLQKHGPRMVSYTRKRTYIRMQVLSGSKHVTCGCLLWLPSLSALQAFIIRESL